jgi:uncharacterized protein
MLLISAGSVQLEAQLREPKRALRGAVTLCHPHPVYGGTMDNRVVYRAGKAAAEAGFAALRFNFRGVGKSTGQFDQGIGEKYDVAAALHWLTDKYPGAPLGLIGYSFGAWVGLQVAVRVPQVRAVVGIGLPLNLYSFEFLSEYRNSARYIIGSQDEFCSRANLDRFAQRIPPPATLHRIEGADHFFSNDIDVVPRLIFDFFDNLTLDQSPA